jgi:hypothetical protein
VVIGGTTNGNPGPTLDMDERECPEGPGDC